MIKKNKIPTILGVILLLLGVFAGVFFINMRQIFRIGASTSAQPKDVRIGNISDGRATISWLTDGQTFGFLNWGESPGGTSRVESEGIGDEKHYTHSIDLSGLEPSTTYYFKINSEGSTYDNNGVPWEFTTGDTLGSNTTSMLVSGSVISPAGDPASRAIIYITINGYLASTLSSTEGNFSYQLSNVRTPDLSSYASISPSSTLLEISIIGDGAGVSSAQIFPRSANPIPPIILGNIYDFRNEPPNIDGQSPDVELSLPESSTPESKFDVSGSNNGTPSAKTVILESHDEGEIVTSTQPEFFGKGPAGETITIEVHSEENITDTVTIPQNGSWSWEVPSNLPPGPHTITISWKDASGITRLLTRSFVVQASELPAFESSPSQTVAPRSSPTATPRATSIPSATPRATSTASAAPVPVTGVSTSSIILYIMGVSVLSFSYLIWKYAQST